METKYENFVILSPEITSSGDSFTIMCSYECDDRYFVETFTCDFPYPNEDVHQQLMVTARLLAISASVSYYKATCASRVTIDFPVTAATQAWVEGLFDHGLREFRFTNRIDLSDVPEIHSEQMKDAPVPSWTASRCLVPIGGGKDSITTLEILDAAGVDRLGFSVGRFHPIDETIKIAGIASVHAQRQIDPRLIEMNNEGAPNGHVPVTAITSLLACIAALSCQCDSVVMSNEMSASEPTRINDAGVEINHQWSKSYEAERLLRDVLASVGVGINYFSLLRSLSEYQIFELFSQYDQYHYAFTSCNRVFALDENKRARSWCGNCDKCRFVFLGLSAFRDNGYVSDIFSKNMFDDESQVSGFLDLLDSSSKPFECVGTINETRIFARHALDNDDTRTSVVGRRVHEFLTTTSRRESTHHGERPSFVPGELSQCIRELHVADYYEYIRSSIGDRRVGVIGLGRDTSAIIRFLDTCAATKNIAIFLPQGTSDFGVTLAGNGLSHLSLSIEHVTEYEELSKCDIVFVSPGVSRYSDEVGLLGKKTTTPLAWWSEQNIVYFPEKLFIGVTGTKGKSTTSSMLAHVLPRSLVAGNLGNAVGDIALDDLFDADYIVMEVSSFQASYVTVSPDIVVLTSLFDCHIDWHRTPEKYRNDKLNLALHGECEVVASDSISDLMECLSAARKERNLSGIDHVTLVSSSGTLRHRNQEMVRHVIDLIPGEFHENYEDALESFHELKYRQEVIAEKNGVIYVSDVLSTAPHASLMAVDDFHLRFPDATIFLLSGGAYREVDLEELRDGLNQRAEYVVTIALPETGHMIADELKSVVHCDELTDGVSYAAAHAQPGDIVLLAPGAPSFHRYKDYTKLAEHFDHLVSDV